MNECRSTHGAAGFALGTYRRPDGKMVCGACGLVFDLPEQWRGRPLPGFVGDAWEQADRNMRAVIRNVKIAMALTIVATILTVATIVLIALRC